MSNQLQKIVPGKQGTLLDMFLSVMPTLTQTQQKSRFASVSANFEFGLFIPLHAANRLVDEAMRKGFTIWCNVDSTSAFLYGAGVVWQDRFTQMMTWLHDIATANQKINVAVHNVGEPMKLILVSV